jgi:hypothetical protein
MGWRFWRCWGSSWALDPEACLGDLERTLRSLGIEPLGGEFETAQYTEHRVYGQDRGPGAEVSMASLEPETSVAFEREATEMEPQAEGVAVSGPAISIEREAGAFLYDEERLIEAGDRVVIAFNDDPTATKTIVLTANTQNDPNMDIIHVGRPIGRALVGQAEGESVDLPAGDNVRQAVILKIEKSEAHAAVRSMATSGLPGINNP